MARPARLVDSKPLLWALLALPAAYIVWKLLAEDLWPDELVAPSGEWSARLIVLALMLTPLSMLLPNARWVRWLVARRRAFGVAAFAYALLHLAFYAAEMETLAAIVDELELPGIWTGWAALALLLPLALTSNDAAVRVLKRGWKRLQRLAYPAALLTLTHWMIVHSNPREALLHFAPLALLQAWRLARLARPGNIPRNRTRKETA